MKNLFCTLVIMILTISSYGQRSVEALFSRYSGSEGFTSITINGDLLKLARALCDDDDKDHDCLPGNITTIRILAQEDGNRQVGNFYDMIERELDRRDYEEFMRVKNSDQDLVMLVRTVGTNFKEFLVVAGGEDNVLIQIKGNMTMKEARRFSDQIKKDNGSGVVDEWN